MLQSIIWFDDLTRQDLALVGGKNASLGEMTGLAKTINAGISPGFAINAHLFRAFIRRNNLITTIQTCMDEYRAGTQTLAASGQWIRQQILAGTFTQAEKDDIAAAYRTLCERAGQVDVAVRSSATAEDLPEASFAGQHESYLNISGEAAVFDAVQRCYASLYTDRAIVYRQENGFSDADVALSVGIQAMVRADLGAAGVMFTLDTGSGFNQVIELSATWGLGETVVQGAVVADQYLVDKRFLDSAATASLVPIISKTPGSKLVKMIYGDAGNTHIVDTSAQERSQTVLADHEILTLARWGLEIERHYGCAMDIEWAKDGNNQRLYILQARPETVEASRDSGFLFHYAMDQSTEPLLIGASVGNAIASGKAVYIDNPGDADEFPEGSILVTHRTDPDWLPLMRKAAAIITDTGGTTSHAAIVSRELRVPAIVGAGNATTLIKSGDMITVDCSSGHQGMVYPGALDFVQEKIDLSDLPVTNTRLMINAAIPDAIMGWWALPVRGVGLARLEFIISSIIKVHPMALLYPERVTQTDIREQIMALSAAYSSPADYFVEQLRESVSKIAAVFYPEPVIVRMSDFKSNEYRLLLGGDAFELEEENPMLGLRGASRYYHPSYREGFLLECQAIERARRLNGYANIIVMIPFCRTPEEADKVLEVMAEAGLVRGQDGLKVYVMCEIPSNVLRVDEFAQRFDGFSIGSNDLTQLVLGIDRDSAELKSMFDARDPAVKKMISMVIEGAHRAGRVVGICGQAPSDHPDFAAFLIESGIDSISLNPDSIPAASRQVAATELELASRQKT
ncbi:MAG: phosphoenolpyruvate synthase [SAR86 cluster bacterium]|uniref:Phosphoenolpyruvate synthase n=1 Tax=SAR86 cluster bacterium TaxID=2030880 RepID=A0A972VYV9_9GAMM|nr:phosphoenolpyruvate synthase [SAR86 cluster bacterium]